MSQRVKGLNGKVSSSKISLKKKLSRMFSKWMSHHQQNSSREKKWAGKKNTM